MRTQFVSAFLLLSGIGLIVTSWTPLTRVTAENAWTNAESAEYGKLTREYHNLNYQSAERLGITEAELAEQREKMKARIDNLSARLEQVRQKPQLWNGYLLWGGILLVAVGVLFHAGNASRRD